GRPSREKYALAGLVSPIHRRVPGSGVALRQVDVAEEALRGLGFRQVRVRHHGSRASVEVEPKELLRALDARMAARIAAAVCAAGFASVVIDPLGYRPGGTRPEGRAPVV